MVEEIAEIIRQQSRLILVDDYELALEQTTKESWAFKNGVAVLNQDIKSLWISLRIFHRRSPGYAVSASGPGFSIEKLLDCAFLSAKNSSPDPWFRFPIWREIKYVPRKVEEFYFPQSLYPQASGSTLSCTENYWAEEKETLISRKRERIRFSYKKKTLGTTFSIANEDQDGLFLLSESRARTNELGDSDERLRLLVSQSKEQIFSKPAELCSHTNLLIAPPAMARILDFLAPAFYADRIHQKSSRTYFEKESPITLINEGNHPTAANSMPFDLEGNPTQKTTLLEKGFFHSFLFDTRAATKENRLSTGSRLRESNQIMPQIKHSLLSIVPTKNSVKDLLENLGAGFIVDSIDSIDCECETTFSYKIRARGWSRDSASHLNPVKNIYFKIQLFDLLSCATAVANDYEIYENCGSPSILFENVPL